MTNPQRSNRPNHASGVEDHVAKEDHVANPVPEASTARRRKPIILLLVAAVMLGLVLKVYPSWRLRQAEKALVSWRYEEANQHLERYPSWGTDAAKMHFLLARVDRQQAGVVKATQNLRTAHAGGFDAQMIACEETLLSIQKGDLSPRRLGELEMWLTNLPEYRPAVYEGLASAKLNTGDVLGAFEVLDRWSQEYPDDARSYYWTGWAHQLQGNDDAALALFVESTNRDPWFVDSYFAQAQIWGSRFQYEEALNAYRKAHQVAPDRLEVAIALGKALWKTHQETEAADMLVPITRQDASIYPAGRIVAQYYARQNDAENVISTVKPMMQHFPDDASLNYLLASAYNDLGKRAEATAAMNKYFVANEHIDRLKSAGFDVPLEQQYAEVTRRALKYRQYDWEQSLKWLDLATQSQPENPQPYEMLASYYREEGSIRQSVQHQNTAESLASRD